LADRSSVVPFIDDVAEAIGSADLVIGRSGASAVAEICAVGRPSLLVPYPHAGDHQRHNAESLERQGAARSIRGESTVERLVEELRELTVNPARLPRMAESAARLGRPHAARTIAVDLLSLAGIESGEAAPAAAPKAPRAPGGFAYQGVA
jgi:UDP-N-acetylglucosamine--N-acetylmuramyl-(pentapeptide) pyrophosphoryl-undecaprenol N-acetylglucosamine transferase